MNKVCIAFSLVASVTAQQQWYVGCGPTADFADLPQAVAAAAAGDTIWVVRECLSTAGEFSSAVIDKPLRIVGVDGISPPGVGYPGRATLRGAVFIRNIPAGEHVILANFRLENGLAAVGPWQGVIIENCAGSVLIEDASAFVPSGYVPFEVVITNCDRVTFRGCEIYLRPTPIEVTNSKVLFTACLITQTIPQSLSEPYPPVNPPGMICIDADVTMVGSSMTGMGAYTNLIPARGALLYDSTLRLGPASLLRGGWSAGSYTRGYDAPVTTPANTSVVLKDPRAIIDTSSWLVPPPTPTDIPSTFHSWVTANQPYGVTVSGPPGGIALLSIGYLLNPWVQTPFGELALDPTTMLPLDLFLLPQPGGSHAGTYFMPSGVPSALGYAFQALTLSPSGQLGITLPSPFTVAYELGQTP